MPQLNPAPWLLIMMTSWLALLILFGPKIVSALQQNPPATNQQTTYETTPWHWPWA